MGVQGFNGGSHSSYRGNPQRNNYRGNNRSGKMSFGSRFKMGFTSFFSTIGDLIKPDDGFYEEERRYGRNVMSSRQYYPNDRFNPPTSRYAGKQSRQEYDMYEQEHPVYRDSKEVLDDDEMIDDSPTRKSGLGRKLKLKTKAGAKKTASIAIEKVTHVAEEVSITATSTVDDIKVAAFKEDAKFSKDKAVRKEEVRQFKEEKKHEKHVAKFGEELDLGFDLALEDIQETFTEIDLLVDDFSAGVWYKSTLTKPTRLLLNSLEAKADTLTAEYLSKRKPLPLAKELEAIQDVILLIPTKTKYVVVPDKKKEAMFRQIEIKLDYNGVTESQYRNYTCDEIYIHAKAKTPLTIYFKISEEQL